MRTIRTLGAGLALLLSAGFCFPAAAAPCRKFADNQQIELRGTIVQSATTMEEEGVRPYKYMMLLLEHSLCFDRMPEDSFNTLVAHPVANKWLGHNVIIRGLMTAGPNRWSIDVKKIEDKKIEDVHVKQIDQIWSK